MRPDSASRQFPTKAFAMSSAPRRTTVRDESGGALAPAAAADAAAAPPADAVGVDGATGSERRARLRLVFTLIPVGSRPAARSHRVGAGTPASPPRPGGSQPTRPPPGLKTLYAAEVLFSSGPVREGSFDEDGEPITAGRGGSTCATGGRVQPSDGERSRTAATVSASLGRSAPAMLPVA